MYTVVDYPTKKELKEQVAKGIKVKVASNSPVEQPPYNGRVTLEGPHHPKPHTWYAECMVVENIIVKGSIT